MSSVEGSAVVIDPAFIGDAVFDAPLVAALKAEAPERRVGLVLRPPSDVIGRLTAADRVHVFDKRGRDGGLAGLRRMAAELRAVGYETALIPHPSVRSAALAWLAGIPVRIGFDRGGPQRWLLTHRVPFSPHHTRGRLSLGGFTDEPRLDALATTLKVGVRPGEGDRPRVGVCVRSARATKRWPVDQLESFIETIGSAAQIVLLGSMEEAALLEGLSAGVADRVESGFCGSLGQLVEAISACDVVVGVDTGPLHIARALGIPVLALFGPTPELSHDFRPVDRVVTVAGLECRPCSPRGPRRCPLGHHECMKSLRGEDVAERLRDQLSSLSEPAP